jgi:hypothetical protein
MLESQWKSNIEKEQTDFTIGGDERQFWETKVADLEAEISRLKAKIQHQTQQQTSMPRGNDIDKIKSQHIREIQQLIERFEEEKQATNDIMRAKVKAQVTSLIPKLKEQFKNAYKDALMRVRNECKAHYSQMIDRMKVEMAEERRVNERIYKERLEEEKRKWQTEMKHKFEQKMNRLRSELI